MIYCEMLGSYIIFDVIIKQFATRVHALFYTHHGYKNDCCMEQYLYISEIFCTYT